jgi:hypothetical protein
MATSNELSPNTLDVSVELDAQPVGVLRARIVIEMAEICQVLQIRGRKGK